MPTVASASPRARPPADCRGALASRWANWPMPNARTGGLPSPASYTNQGNGTVRDNVTCLLWQRTPAPQRHTFTDARAYCARLKLVGDGWRLPSRIEVMSLVDTTRSGPAIDTTAFPGTPARFFWTSSPWAVTKAPPRAWIVNFYEGLTSNAAEQSGSYQVRCVRGGSGSGSPAYRTGGGRVTDPTTGLTWQRATAPGTMSPAAADAYCAALTVGGRAWRLPTVKELATLVDDSRVSPAIDRAAFPDTPGTGAYWSASAFAPETSQRWFLSYNDGITSHRQLAGAYVRYVS
ncbi:Lcl C-terminal domain-containing protein [Streptomyces atroolivaceus]